MPAPLLFYIVASHNARSNRNKPRFRRRGGLYGRPGTMLERPRRTYRPKPPLGVQGEVARSAGGDQHLRHR